jgi:hypothetical protein
MHCFATPVAFGHVSLTPSPPTRRSSRAATGGGTRGATGTRAPHGRPRTGSAPVREAVGTWASLEAPSSFRDPRGRGSPGRLAAPALRRFLSRSDLWLPAAPLPERRSHLEALGRSAPSRHCWRFAANGLPGPPGSRAIRSPSGRRSLPRGEVNGPIHVPSQAATRAHEHTAPRASRSVHIHNESKLPIPAPQIVPLRWW